MNDKLFIPGAYVGDKLYGIIRDAENNTYEGNFRLCCEELWIKYRPFADTDFRDQLKQDFNARVWEMYLMCALLEQSLQVKMKRTNKGPDILIEHQGHKIWFEAITPGMGAEVNPDRVPTTKLGKVFTIPDEQITLRYCSAICEKWDKYIRYRKNSVVAVNDAYIIALNSSKIDLAFDHDIPRILKALFPIGDKFYTVDRNTKTIIDTGHKFRPAIQRSSGAGVTTQIFNDPTYSGISAVLYSRAGVSKLPLKTGEDFVFVHNPLATSKVEHGFIKIGKEYIAQEETNKYKIVTVDWNT